MSESLPSAESDALTEAVRRIEAARSEHWQEHLRKHPLATAQSCPRCYGVHDAYAHAATILRDMIRQTRVTPPAKHRTFHCDQCGEPAMNIDANGLCRSCRPSDTPPGGSDV